MVCQGEIKKLPWKLDDDPISMAKSAKEVKKPEVADAEREKQQKFLEQLRARSAPQPEEKKAKPKKNKRKKAKRP